MPWSRTRITCEGSDSDHLPSFAVRHLRLRRKCCLQASILANRLAMDFPWFLSAKFQHIQTRVSQHPRDFSFEPWFPSGFANVIYKQVWSHNRLVKFREDPASRIPYPLAGAMASVIARTTGTTCQDNAAQAEPTDCHTGGDVSNSITAS